MAIIVPSKNVYSIVFDPVIDNIIDKVYTNEHYGDYEEKIFFNKTFNGYSSKTSSLSQYITDYNDISNSNPLPSITGISGIARSLILSWQKEYAGFKLAKDWLLYATTIQKEVDQEINLEMSATYKYYNTAYPSGMTEGESSYSDEKEVSNLQFELKEFVSVQAFVNEYFDLTSQSAPYLPDYTVKSLNDSKLLIIGYIPTQTEVIFYFLINKDGYYYDSDRIRSPILKSVDIKIYNNVDWQVRSYGNGNKPFVVNENKSKLLQTNTKNKNVTQGKYLSESIIDKWKYGKQTATITCAITDYYDEEGNEIISPNINIRIKCLQKENPSIGFYRLTFQEIETRALDGKEIIIQVNQIEEKLIVSKYNVETGIFNAFSFFPVIKAGETYIVSNIRFPAIFHIGDIVIPYRYTNQGDKPLSYNKDFTPKQFKVVGTKLITNQGVSQELTLQEV